MPGLHLLVSVSENDIDHDADRQTFVDSLSKTKHFEWYQSSVVCNNSTTIVGKSTYNSYPFSVFEDERNITFIDGIIYNKSSEKVKEELKSIFSLPDLASLKENIKDFILSTHGEFVVANFDKQLKQFMIFNDVLGRLPFYYSSFGSEDSVRFVASRELNFVIPFLKKRDVEQIAVAEYLLFGYILGDKTILNQVKRLLPCSLLVIDAEKKSLLLEQTYTWNLDPKEEIDTSVHVTAADLAHLFNESLKEIVSAFSKNFTHIISLSAGLDSRATLGGFVASGLDSIACSFPSGEDQLSKELSTKLNVGHHFISSPSEINFEEYLKVFGFVNLGLRSRVTFLFGLREKIGENTVLYTGDGGDKVLAPLNSKSSNIEELLDHLLKSEHIYKLTQVSSLLNISVEELQNHLKKHLSNYPEQTMNGKFAHFKVFERGFKWLFRGEDRSRFFMWSTTPFYWFPFFKMAMDVPQKQKANYILYKYFLSTLDPQLNKVRYYNRLVSLSLPDWVLRMYLSVFDWLKSNFYEIGKTSPVDFLSGNKNKPHDEETLNVKNFTIDYLNHDSFSFIEMPSINKLVKEETNDLKLSNVATLAAYLKFLSKL